MKDLTYRQELLRKALHVATGAVALWLGVCIERAYGLGAVKAALFVALLFSLVVDYFRNELRWNIYLLPFLQRKREVGHLHAVTHALMGALIALQFFDRNVTLAALAMFFFGDAAAAVVGRRFGKAKLRGRKSVIGSATMFIVSLIAGLLLVPAPIALAMALAATVVELLVDVIDDSLVIILFAGFVGDVLLRLI